LTFEVPMIEQGKQKPWYKEPLVWFIIGIPLSAILVGALTIILATVTYDGLVVDDYYKRGLEINKRLERDRNAKNYGLVANIDTETPGLLDVQLHANEQFRMPERLNISFLHPTRKEMDIRLVLNRIDVSRFMLIDGKDWRLLFDYFSEGKTGST